MAEQAHSAVFGRMWNERQAERAVLDDQAAETHRTTNGGPGSPG
jgi:hypothetical protein